MNLVNGSLSMRSQEPCGLILAIVSECACPSYPTSHEQSRQYMCYSRCTYSSAVECLCFAGAHRAEYCDTSGYSLSPSAVNLKSPPRKESETVEKMAINRPRAPKFFTLKIR